MQKEFLSKIIVNYLLIFLYGNISCMFYIVAYLKIDKEDFFIIHFSC